MTYLEFLENIGFNKKQIEDIKNIKLSNRAFSTYYNLLKINEYLFYNYSITFHNKDKEEFYLKFFTIAAYKKLDKAVKYFKNEQEALLQFSSLSLLALKCKMQTGKLGINNPIYGARIINSRIVRFFGFEFQEVSLKENTKFKEKMYKKNTKAINIVIPDFRFFSYENFNKAIDLAKIKFKRYKLFVCEHWLLSPTLKEYVSPNNDIVKFSDKFQIYHTFEDTKSPEIEIIKTFKLVKEHKQIENDLIDAIKKMQSDDKVIGNARGIFNIKEQ